MTFRWFARRIAALVLVAMSGFAVARAGQEVPPCRILTEAGHAYSVCEFDLRRYEVKAFWRDADGKLYGSLGNLIAALERAGRAPVVAMNAGMYNPELAPIGLYVENGIELRPANLARGPGNFHLKPNGVFYIRGTEANILETSAYLKRRPMPAVATQSGPMLVIDGKLHPRFDEKSLSRKVRNGVGVSNDHTVAFAISSDAVTFAEFAELFRSTLSCPNALFLDGTISSLYAPSLNRADAFWPAGPMLAVFGRPADP